MIGSMRWLAPVLLLAGLMPASGQTERATAANPMAAIRVGRWDAAAMIASGLADPAAAKLVTYFRLSSPNGGTPREIAAFVTENPDWPAPSLLDRRRQEALAAETDDSQVLDQCRRLAVTLGRARVRCAQALQAGGQVAEAGEMARRTWITGLAGAPEATDFLAHWGGVLAPEDEIARFEALAWSNPDAAERQMARLTADPRRRAVAWLALRRDDPLAPAMVAVLPSGPGDPALMLEQARNLRRTGQQPAALTLWLSAGDAAQDAVASFPARLAEFWNERQRLARQLLRAGNARDAYDLVAAHGQGSAETTADARGILCISHRLHK